MKKGFFALVLLILVFDSQAQTGNYQPGYVVNSKGDTLKGEIDYRNWDLNPVSISFKSKNAVTNFTVKDISAFGIIKEDVYKRTIVTYQLNTLNALNAGVEFNESTKTDTVFLRQLIKGKYNLYELLTIQRPYYFIESIPGQVTELVSRVKKSEDNFVTEDKQYKDLLLAYAMKENVFGKLQTSVTRMSYQSANLIRVVSVLNGNNNFDLTSAEKSKKVNFLEVGAGFVNTSYSSSGPATLSFNTPVLLNSASFTSSIKPCFELGLMLGSSRRFNKAGFGFQLGYSSSVFKGSSDSKDNSAFIRKQDYYNSFNLFRFSLLVNYVFNPLDKYKFYVAPVVSLYKVSGVLQGTTTETSFTGTQTTRPDYPEFGDTFLSFGSGLGIIMNDHRIALKVDYSTNNSSANISSVTKINSLRISVSYHYKLFSF